ncbi:MAG: phospholipase, partial [Gemmatimonadetes bacterium]|nr:phospholipase [Gemmatimonadota bacterium]
AAPGRTWYPQSFMAPIAANEPYLSRSLEMVGATLEMIDVAGIPSSRVILLGFSQGACLATEFVARNPRRYGGLAALTGGLIGPPDGLPTYDGSLRGTPVFLGAGDPDAHVPWTRVEETAQVLREMEADITLRRYPGMPHRISEDQVEAVRVLLASLREETSGEEDIS